MKRSAKMQLGILVGICGLVGLVAAPAASADQSNTTLGQEVRTVEKQVINMDLSHLKWRPLDPGTPDGAAIAALWGDPFSGGPYGALLRVPAGFESPMHTHSHDERVVQIKGMSIHWQQGESRETAPRMTPGDYILVPAGVPHVSAAGPDEESIEFITQDGSFDFALVPPANP